MKLKAKVTIRQYLKLLFSLAYSKPVMIFLICFALLLVLWITLFHLDILNLPEPVVYQYITLLLIAVIQPTVILTTIIRNYYSSNHLRETLDIDLSDDKIKIKGESFYMEILWTKIYKLAEKKNWFLIYQNNLSAILIPKKDLSTHQIKQIQEILGSVKTIK
ncbi:YcxB family protein [Chryseobacterium sp. 09-1422]|uniref:YcxB family protein n=1 Tax=Chryseobacterium kimseyorum TaxID=2984028 RepID=A0ABT3HTB9_9FLAO|nr:YcxB family protein [Chryseobacterium kimseyorum]MCW3167035.1 YcxB family protein [Chryseobacterium kimseyorum]